MNLFEQMMVEHGKLPKAEDVDEREDSIDPEKSFKKTTKVLNEEDVRKYTNKLYELLEEGVLDGEWLAKSLLVWLSEDEVKEFAEYYDIMSELDDEDLDESLTESINKKVRGKLTEDLKLYTDIGDYEPWSGAVDTWDKIVEEDKVNDLEFQLEELYPEGLSVTELNDLLWFDGDTVLEWLGISEKESGDFTFHVTITEWDDTSGDEDASVAFEDLPDEYDVTIYVDKDDDEDEIKDKIADELYDNYLWSPLDFSFERLEESLKNKKSNKKLKEGKETSYKGYKIVDIREPGDMSYVDAEYLEPTCFIYKGNRCVGNAYDVTDAKHKIDQNKSWNPVLDPALPADMKLSEDTVKKSNGKWTNRGDTGEEHGEFKTKKAADAQRRAMYARGYKGESVYSPSKNAVNNTSRLWRNLNPGFYDYDDLSDDFKFPDNQFGKESGPTIGNDNYFQVNIFPKSDDPSKVYVDVFDAYGHFDGKEYQKLFDFNTELGQAIDFANKLDDKANDLSKAVEDGEMTEDEAISEMQSLFNIEVTPVGYKGESKKKVTERNLTRSERHNRNMDRIFNTKKEQDKKFADFLRKNGYSEDEIKSLEDADKLNAEIYDKFGGSKAIGDILKESSTPYVKWVQHDNGKWSMWGGSNSSELDPNFLDRINLDGKRWAKISGFDFDPYINVKIAKSGEYPEGVTDEDIFLRLPQGYEEEINESIDDDSNCYTYKNYTICNDPKRGLWIVKELEGETFSTDTDAEERIDSMLDESKNLKEKTYYDHNDLGTDVGEYQEWVDYDMDRYGRISVETRRKLRNAGLTLVRDQYGDYEVIADEPIHTRKNRYDKRKYDDELDEAVDEPVDEKNKGLGLKFI